MFYVVKYSVNIVYIFCYSNNISTAPQTVSSSKSTFLKNTVMLVQEKLVFS